MAKALATLGGGCFWGIEAVFVKIDGVLETAVGYMGGDDDQGTYEQVCSGKSGHAEVVQLIYDDQSVDYEALLAVFWDCHDPTQMNRQGVDVGTQYRSVIFYHSQEQQKTAQRVITALNQCGRYDLKVATAVVEADRFHRAEDYHQQYLARRGGGSCGI